MEEQTPIRKSAPIGRIQSWIRITILLVLTLLPGEAFALKILDPPNATSKTQQESSRRTIEGPERYREIWPLVAWFYEGVLEGDSTEHYAASLLPESIKHPLIPPILLILFTISLLIGSIWFLVAEFKVSLGWGFGQLAANLASFLLIVPGLIVAIVFLCRHWDKGKVPFLIQVAAWLIGLLSFLMLPSWAVPG